MKTDSPAFQFYAADYLADMYVEAMTLEEQGAYIRLLAYCWREGDLPNEDQFLSALCKGCSTTVITTVKRCFEESPSDSTRLIHPRLEEEREKQSSWRNKCSEGGRKSADKRRKPPKSGDLSKSPLFAVDDSENEVPLQVNSKGSIKGSSTLLLQSPSSDIKLKEWFAKFWDESWKRGARVEAERMFIRLLKAEGELLFVLMLAGVKRQKPYYMTKEPDFRPHLSTWLNQRRWTDEEDQAPATATPIRPGQNVSGHKADPNSPYSGKKWVPSWRTKPEDEAA